MIVISVNRSTRPRLGRRILGAACPSAQIFRKSPQGRKVCLLSCGQRHVLFLHQRALGRYRQVSDNCGLKRVTIAAISCLYSFYSVSVRSKVLRWEEDIWQHRGAHDWLLFHTIWPPSKHLSPTLIQLVPCCCCLIPCNITTEILKRMP